MHASAAEVQSKLHLLGLAEEDLAAAVRHGDEEASYCTENDPRVLKNFTRWGKTFRGLGDRLASAGWRHEERRCFPIMVNPGGSICIAVSSGDANTGRPGPDPRTRNPKGPLTKRIIDENQFQFPGFETPTLAGESLSPPTWFLLFYVDADAEEIRAELSLPIAIDADGCVAGWHDRIILSPVSRALSLIVNQEDEDEQVDIAIEMRGQDI